MTSAQGKTTRWPTELKLSKDKRLITVVFDDGMAFDMSAEYLRVSSPSAEVRGHSPAQRKTVYGKIDVSIAALNPIGNYAVQIVFNDGHDSGFYDWGYLYELGTEYVVRWEAYLKELDEKRLRREPLFPQ